MVERPIRREVDLRTIAICLGLLALFAARLHAAEWSIGASGGFNYFIAGEGDFQSFGTGFPYSGPSLEFQPAFRIERRGERSRNGIAVDLGFGFRGHEDTFTTHSIVVLGSLRRAFGEGRPLAAFASLSGGLGYFSYEDLSRAGSGRLSGAGAIYGGGVGVFHRLGNGHGRIRMEIRYQRVEGAADDGFVVTPEGHSASAQLGFDLIVK